MKFYSLIIFLEEVLLEISLSYWLIISLQDLSYGMPSDRTFRKKLVCNHKYARTINTCYF